MASSFALLILVIVLALAFDYINGFHDTANAVATVVSTNVLPGRTAVLLAAVFNVGTLVQPTTKDSLNSSALPRNLYSHSDQTQQWQSSDPNGGGTGWGAEFAKLCNKPLFVFDQDQGSWFEWGGDEWKRLTETPVITHPHFTGTGTREPNAKARQAIEELFDRSFGAAR